MTYDCPTPEKGRYATAQAAALAAHRTQIKFGEPMYEYECICSWWHLSRSEQEPDPDPADAAPADIAALVAATDASFRTAVVADVRGEGAPGRRAALRHYTNLRRWRRHLGVLLHDVDRQLACRRGDPTLAAHDWRRRTLGYQTTLRRRLIECQRRRAAEHAVVSASRAEGRRRDLEAAQRAGASVKELRAKAGELAVDRLIDAHPGEFARLLAETFAGVGLAVPESAARRLSTEAAS